MREEDAGSLLIGQTRTLFFFFGGERKVSRPSTATIAAMATGYSILFPSSNRNIHLTRLGARIYTFVLDFLLFFLFLCASQTFPVYSALLSMLMD